MAVLWRDKPSRNAYISMHASICSTSCSSWSASQKISGTSDLVDGANSYHSVKGKLHGSGFYAAWVQYDTGAYSGIKTVWGSEYIVGTGWTTPEVIQTDRTQDAQYPIVGFDDADNPIVAYYQFGGAGNAIRTTSFLALCSGRLPNSDCCFKRVLQIQLHHSPSESYLT